MSNIQHSSRSDEWSTPPCLVDKIKRVHAVSNIQHSSRSNEWWTPAWLIDKIKRVLGYIGLDPASSVKANYQVRADTIFTQEDDALSKLVWATSPTTVYMNPPGGKIGNKSKTALFWQRLIDMRDDGLLEHAIVMGFSVEHLAVTQGCTDSMMDFPLCIPRKRIKFVSPEGTFNSPTHSNVIVYVPGIKNKTGEFKAEFSDIGKIMYPSHA